MDFLVTASCAALDNETNNGQSADCPFPFVLFKDAESTRRCFLFRPMNSMRFMLWFNHTEQARRFLCRAWFRLFFKIAALGVEPLACGFLKLLAETAQIILRNDVFDDQSGQDVLQL